MPNYTHIPGVHINTPCHENWEAMTEAERGRFCNQCAKIVYDFTDAAPEDFFKRYRENKGQVCGRFYAQEPRFWDNQNNRAARLLHQSKAAVLALMGMLSFSTVKSQSCPPPVKFGKLQVTRVLYNLAPAPATVAAHAADTIKTTPGFISLSFNIRDEDTRQLILKKFTVTVDLKEYDLTINDVSNGIATFQIPVEMVHDSALIEVRGEGYKPVFIKLADAANVQDVYLKDSVKAEKERQKARKEWLNKHRRHWWQFWKPKLRIRHRMGAPAF